MPLFVIGAVGQQAACFAIAAGCNVDLCHFPKAKHVGVPMPVFNAHFHAELIKDHIARLGEGLAQVDFSTALFVVATKPAIAKNHAPPARAEAIIARLEKAHVQRGDRCDHFENRRGWIFALKAAVEQGNGRVCLQEVPGLGVADGTRVKTRFADYRENCAGLWVHRHQATAHAVGKCVLGNPLHAPVERQGYVFARDGRRCLFWKTADFAPLGIDFDIFDALRSPHAVFKEPLDPALSNLIVIAIAQGFQLGILRWADQPHIAQDMRGQGEGVRRLGGYQSQRVKNGIAPSDFGLDFHTRQIVAVFFDNGNGLKIHIAFEFDRIVKMQMARLQFFRDALTWQVHNLSQAFKKAIARAFFNISQQARGNHRDGIRRAVIDQNRAIAVADQAAIGLNDDRLHGVFF